MRIFFSLCFVLAAVCVVAADQDLEYRATRNVRPAPGPLYFLSSSTRRCIPLILETPEQRQRRIDSSANFVVPLRSPIHWLNVTPGGSLIGEEEEAKLGLGDLGD